MDEACVRNLRAWAERNGSVRELWHFGSRAKGTARLESDTDIALALMPPQGKHDWALGNYYDLRLQWKEQLEAIVGGKVDLQEIRPGTSFEVEVHATGKLLWPHA